MPSVPTVPRRRQLSDNDDDDEGSESSNPSPPTSNKKRRLGLDFAQVAGDYDDSSQGSEDEESDDNGAPEPTQANLTNNVAHATTGPGGFKPGAIVRIKLRDFVTYSNAEFFPGPKLNMVIGPNGTGKSTLVCAICLGLGWGPQHLGRAKDIGEFVKNDCDEATIEIELAGPPRYSRNPIICRNIKKEGNKSSFTINGKTASRMQVLKFAQSFSIQIDNLCQFLPQDRVSEFAKLTPIQLLESTQRAAAAPEMLKWHEDLKVLRSEQKKLQTNNKGDLDTLANLQNRQEMQRPDVERMRQREQVKRRIEIMEGFRPITKYKEYRELFQAAKEDRQRVEGELEHLKAELEPALQAVNSKERYCSQITEVIKHKKREVERAVSVASKLESKIEQFETSMKDLSAQIEAEKKAARQHRQEDYRNQQSLESLRRQLNEEPVEFDVDFYNEQIREKRAQLREIENKAGEIKVRRQPFLMQMNEKKENIRQAEQQLKSLDSQTGQQEEKLRRISPHSFQAYRRIQNEEIRKRFENPVFGPPIVSCSVNDPEYADAIESMFQRNDLIAFTVQSRNDFRTLQRILNTEMKLSDISIRTSTVPLDNFQSPMSADGLRRLGFDGWAKDFLNGPDPVLAVLCSENRLHQAPITLRDISDDEFNRLTSGPISLWVAGKQTYQVTRRREYGPSATSTRVREVRPARVWTSQPVDASTRNELEQSVQMMRDELSEVQREMEGDKTEVTRLRETHTEISRARDEIEREKSEKQKALVQFRAIPEKIRQQEAKQQNIQGLFEEIRARVVDIRNQQDRISFQKAETTVEYCNAVEDTQKLNEELIGIEIRLVEGISDLTTLKERNADYQNMLETKSREVEDAVRRFRDMAKEGRKLSEEAKRAALAARDHPDAAELLPNFREHTSDQLEADIDSEKARLELTQGGNSNVIKEFEDRGRQIEKLQDKLADFQTKLADYDHAINEVRGQWEPKLDELVKRINDAFSDSFARIGCAGQVSVDKAEDEAGLDGESGGTDFDQWSIQIHVKFREHESLSLLDSHRQSGGERAVSTIFYLMALQSLSTSPFRVVDEINQGMDPRNERMVHGRLVDIACATGDDEDENTGRGGSQYFLITPKLLDRLVYKPGMKVLCIVSGEGVFENYGDANPRRAVERLRDILRQRDGKKGKGKARALPPMARSNGDVNVYG